MNQPETNIDRMVARIDSRLRAVAAEVETVLLSIPEDEDELAYRRLRRR